MKNLNTIVPFYDSTDEQFFRKQDLILKSKYFRLVCGTKRLTPFIIRRLTTGGTTATLTFNIINAATGATIQTPVSATYLNFDTGTSFDNIWYDASADFASDLPIGVGVYVKITDASQTPTKIYYSEVFMVVASLSDYTLVEWSNDIQLGNIKGTFVQKMYVDNILKVREYQRKDTGTERDSFLVKESMIVLYVDNLNLLKSPAFVCDALILLPLMDTVQVTDIFTDCFIPMDIKVKDPEWNAESGGTEAKLVIQFIKEMIIKKLTFKEMSCSCPSGGGTAAVINEGQNVVTAGTPLPIAFDTVFTDQSYTINFRAFDDNGNPVFLNITAKTVSYFTVNALVDCTVEWTAIRV